MNIKEYTEIISKNELVLVDFYAKWCGPCKMLAPIIDSLKDIEKVSIDIDDSRELIEKYSIMSVPTLMLFKSGECLSKHIGFIRLEELEEWINKYR